MIDKIKKWAKETFLNAETALGAPGYIFFGLVCIIFEERVFLALGICSTIYGIYVFFVNRISQERKKKKLIDG
jgi:hypothetical protein